MLKKTSFIHLRNWSVLVLLCVATLSFSSCEQDNILVQRLTDTRWYIDTYERRQFADDVLDKEITVFNYGWLEFYDDETGTYEFIEDNFIETGDFEWTSTEDGAEIYITIAGQPTFYQVLTNESNLQTWFAVYDYGGGDFDEITMTLIAD
ncbi:MAG: hypothetical protein ACPGXL_08650 [Chitinophagales bacterium]